MSDHSEDESEVQEELLDFDVDALGGRSSKFSPQMHHLEGVAYRNSPCGCYSCMLMGTVYGVVKVKLLNGKWVPDHVVGGKAVCTPPEEVRKFLVEKVGGNEVLFSQAFETNHWRAIAHNIAVTTFAMGFFPEPTKKKRARKESTSPQSGSSSGCQVDKAVQEPNLE